MMRHMCRFLCGLAGLVASSAAGVAGDHYYFASPVVVGPPVVYAAPVVSYQPAYVVPTSTIAVHSYPVSTVSYSTSYYAPMVPAYPVHSYYARPTVVAPAAYVVPGRYRRHHRRFRGVEVEIERDGDIEIDYR